MPRNGGVPRGSERCLDGRRDAVPILDAADIDRDALELGDAGDPFLDRDGADRPRPSPR